MSRREIIFNGVKFWYLSDETKRKISEARQKYNYKNLKIGEALIIKCNPDLFYNLRYYKGINNRKKTEACCIATSVRNCIMHYSKKHNLGWRVATRTLFDDDGEKIGYEIIRIE